MKSKKKTIILCSIVFIAIVAIGVLAIKSGCMDHLLRNEQQQHEELLTILIKATGKEHLFFPSVNILSASPGLFVEKNVRIAFPVPFL